MAGLGVIFAAGNGETTGAGDVVAADGFAAKAVVTATGAGFAGAAVVTATGVGVAGAATAGNAAIAGLLCTGVAVGDDVIPRTDKHAARTSMIKMARMKLMNTSLLIVLACCPRRSTTHQAAAADQAWPGLWKPLCAVEICRQWL